MSVNIAKMSGIKKIATFMVAIGPEASARLMKYFMDDEVEKISKEVANLGMVKSSYKNNVINEFIDLNEAQTYILNGGISVAKEILEKSFGAQKAQEIVVKLTAAGNMKPFESIQNSDPQHLSNFIINEHPQTIALILSNLNFERAAIVLNSLPEKLQSDVAKRIATMERTSPEIVKEVEKVLEEKMLAVSKQDLTVSGGIDTLVGILNKVDRGTEKSIMETMEQENRQLAEDIRKKMFIFEDILSLDDFSIRRVLRDVDFKDLAVAIKGSSDEVAEKIYDNISKRAAEMLREDVEFLGPVRLRDVEDTQQKIVQVIRRLDEAGEIILSRGGSDVVIA